MLTSSSFDALTGTQRAAVLVVALGVETASQLLPALDDDEVERLTVEVARLDRVPATLVADVLAAFAAASGQETPVEAAGGLDAARALLGGLDGDRAGLIRPRVEAATEGAGFDLVQSVPSTELAEFLAEEHPQAAAVILSRLPARPAADALGHLPEALRGDVIRRLSTLATPPPAALASLDAALRARFGGTRESGPKGPKRAADILMQSGRATGRAVLDDLQRTDPQLADEIEGMLFVFEDLGRIDPLALGRVLSASDQGALARALSAADADLSDRVFANVSERVGAALREEIEMAGTVAPADVEEAQRAVVAVALELAEAGSISLEPVPEQVAEPVA
ncbi:flagellar motor switch protein FliG [Rubrivirga sp. IMCC43871]|uniref:flagellar motor switch protein FliG n=1 Tax=Rubrivirga sp. IMCC43871 TaxID=3391575 RepID=UPI0039900B2F